MKFGTVVVAIFAFSLLTACDSDEVESPAQEDRQEETDNEEGVSESERDGLQIRIMNETGDEEALKIAMDGDGHGVTFCYSDGSCEDGEIQELSTRAKNRMSAVVSGSQPEKVAVGVEATFTVAQGVGISQVHAGEFAEMGPTSFSFQRTTPVHYHGPFEEGDEVTVTYGEIHD